MNPDEHRRIREQLGAYLLGHLDTVEAAAVRAHLEGCADCRGERDELAPLVPALRAVDPDRLSDLPTVRPTSASASSPRCRSSEADGGGSSRCAGLQGAAAVFVAAVVLVAGQLAGSSAPLLQVVQAGAPNFPERAFAIMALLAVSNTALINLIMASRLLYGLSDQGIVPAVFSRVHERRRSPWVAILVVTGVAMALVSTGSIGALASTTVLLLLLIFTLVNIAVLVLRRDELDVEHFHAPTPIPVLGAVSSAALAIYTVIDDPFVAVRALLLLVAGLVLWLVNRWVTGRVETIDVERLET